VWPKIEEERRQRHPQGGGDGRRRTQYCAVGEARHDQCDCATPSIAQSKPPCELQVSSLDWAPSRLALTPEAKLDGRRIDEFFRADFFATEFWLLWSTIMGPPPQHSAMEMRRYMNRFLPLLPDLSVMSHVLRTRFDQYEAIIEPMVAWLRPRGVAFLMDTFVRDIGFAPSPGSITASRLDYDRDGAGSDPPLVSARSCAATRLSGPVRSGGAICGAEDARLIDAA
jgi:hypothetical protein